MDTISTIDLSTIPVFQADPFTAIELRRGTEIVNEKRRDYSGRKSYELLPVGFKIKAPDTTENAPGLAAGVVRIYPNPSAVATNVQGDSIPAGEYVIEIVAVNGETLLRHDVTVKESGSLLETLLSLR